MKIKVKRFHEERKCPSCNWGVCNLFQLDGWDKKDWLCANCFVEELLNSEAEYQVIPKKDLEKSDNDLRNKIIEVFKDNKDKGLSTEQILEKLKQDLKFIEFVNFEKELIKLLVEGFIFEAKPNKFRWLG